MKNAKQKKRPLSVLLRGKSGLTLVEMIVTFALLCIFVVAAVGMFSSSASIYNKIRVISSAQNVCEIIMDKVAGEVDRSSSRRLWFRNGGGRRRRFPGRWWLLSKL